MKTCTPHSFVFYASGFLILLTSLVFPKNNASAADLFSDTNFFPIGVWLQSPSNASAYKNTGINLFVGLWEGPTKEQLDQLKAAGMPVLCDQNNFALANLDAYGNTIAGWTHMDEPDNAQSDGNGGYGPCIAPDSIIKQYATWKAKDSKRPVYLNLGQGVSNIDYIGRGSACHARTDIYHLYMQGCDIVSYDIYPVNSEYAAIKGNLWYVAKGIDSLLIWSNGQKKEWCWIECTRIDSSSSAAPTPDQVKAEVWMALIHGAKGFGYFCHSWYGGFKEAGWLDNAQMKTAITAINTRIANLAPVLSSTSLSNGVTVTADKPIDILSKNYSGSTYIFAVAMLGSAATGQFSIPGLSVATRVDVLDENRTLTTSDGKFQDSFNGYGVHLYKVNSLSGTITMLSGKVFPRRQSPRIISIMQGKAGGVFGDARRNSPILIYSINGKFLSRWSRINAGYLKVPDGAYIMQPE
jgi:hypothetical protein